MRNLFLFIAYSFVCVSINMACKKEYTVSHNRALIASPVHPCGDSVIAGVITSNLFLDSCKIYKLSGTVYVSNNATLTIPKGALMQGIKGSPGGTRVI